MKVIIAFGFLLLATPAAAQMFQRFERNTLAPIAPEAPAKPAEPDFALPDPVMTPGAVDRSVTLKRVCKERTRHRRPPSTKLCDAVFSAYSIPPEHRYEYECDHDLSISLGGATVRENLWPQPNAEAAEKDKLEVVLHDLVCAGQVSLETAQQEMLSDWTQSYRRRIGPLPSSR